MKKSSTKWGLMGNEPVNDYRVARLEKAGDEYPYEWAAESAACVFAVVLCCIDKFVADRTTSRRWLVWAVHHVSGRWVKRKGSLARRMGG